MRIEIKIMSGSSAKSIATIKYPGIESVGIDKHQTFVANLMKLGLTFYGSAFKLFEKFCFNALFGMKKRYQMHSFWLRYSSKNDERRLSRVRCGLGLQITIVR